MKIKGELRIGHIKSPLITREVEIDEDQYNRSINKEEFIQQAFIHEIADELEVKCVVI